MLHYPSRVQQPHGRTWSLALLSRSIFSLSRSRRMPEPSFPSSSLSAFFFLGFFGEAAESSSMVLLPEQEGSGRAATAGSGSAAGPEVPSGGRFAWSFFRARFRWVMR